MNRKFVLRLIAGILSSLATIVGTFSVFKVAQSAQVIAMLFGAIGLGATITSAMYERRRRKGNLPKV